MAEHSELGAPPPVDPVEARAAEARLLSRLLPRRADAAVRIGRYRVLDKLGKGAHGVVYSAYDPQLDRRVAIKLLERTEEAGTRILREARMLAKLSHPNVVGVYEVGTHEGDVFVAMEFVQGSTLGQWLAVAHRTPTEIVEVFANAAEGLAHAHDQGIVHRDVKPANVMIDDEGRVRVMDFGLARLLDRAAETSGDAPRTTAEATWSSGTPAYMAPEQHRGGTVDGRSDQYALCLAAWEALLGSHPFVDSFGDAATPPALHEAKLDPPPSLPAPSTAGLNRRQLAALRRGLSPRPDDRWPHIRMLARALRPKPRPVARMMVGTFVLGVAATAVLPMLIDDDPCAAANERFESSWGEGSRRSLVDSLESSSSLHSPATAKRVSARIDGYAQRWVETARSVCAGDLPPALETAQNHCLEVERARFDATVGLLREGDADLAQRANELVLGLPDPGRCQDTDATLSHAGNGAELLETRRRIATASSRTGAGRYPEAAKMLADLDEDVARLGSPAVSAEFEMELADVLRALGQPENAHESGLRAIEQAAASERWDVLAAAASTLSYVLSEQLGRPGEGLEYAQIGVRVARGHGVDPAIALVAHLHHASALSDAGNDEAALAAYEETAKLARAASRPLHEAAALADGAAVESRLGRTEDAINAMTRALEISWDVRGFDHPEDGVTRLNLATTLIWQGRDDEAEPHLMRARRAFESAYGAGHEDVARVDQALGNLESGRGNLKAALARYRSAYEVRKGHDGPQAHLKVETLVGMASTLSKLQRHEDALPFFEDAIAASTELPMFHANAQRWYGDALARLGRDDEAEEHLRLAYSAAHDLQPGGRHATHYGIALGRHLVDGGAFEKAAPVLDTVWPRIREDEGFNISLRGEAAWLVGQIRSAQGRACEAHALVSEASEALGVEPGGAVGAWLAEHQRPAACETND